MVRDRLGATGQEHRHVGQRLDEASVDAVVTHGADADISLQFANDRCAERPDDQRRRHEGEDHRRTLAADLVQPCQRLELPERAFHPPPQSVQRRDHLRRPGVAWEVGHEPERVVVADPVVVTVAARHRDLHHAKHALPGLLLAAPKPRIDIDRGAGPKRVVDATTDRAGRVDDPRETDAMVATTPSLRRLTK